MFSTTTSPHKAVRAHRQELIGRVRALSVAAASVLGLIAGGFWYVQVVRGGHYAELAENNRLRQLTVRAPRGLVYDRHGSTLIENVPSYTLLLDRSRSADLEATLKFAAAVLERPVERLAEEVARAGALPSFEPVPVARNLTLAQVARLAAAGWEHPELEIEVSPLRFYRHGRQTAHLLGYIGEVGEAGLAAAGGRLHPGDRVGRDGVERTYDDALRGVDGERVVVVDSRGRTLEEHRRAPARPGRRLELTLDLPLQQAAERLLRERVGAVVALDPADGAVRVLVSSPAYDPNAFARGLEPGEWQALLADGGDPLQNRALANAYSPGSVFKIVMATAGLAEGVIVPGHRVYCNGATTIYGRSFACGRRGGHGWVDLRQALERSCNVYFYHLGQTLGIERIARWAHAYGLGEPTGIDLAGERPGLVPDPAWSRTERGHPWYPGETISVAIGQGPLLVTPIQLARMTAAVANGGRLVTPHMVADPDAPAPVRRLPLAPGLLALVRDGLTAVVNDAQGTAYWSAHSDLVTIAGKTGTVQVVGREGLDGRARPEALQNHAWFVSFAPAGAPELVVVAFVEHGGSGSGGAAPIARALYEEYFARHPDPAVAG